MNEAVQNSKNIYTIEYQLQVPVSDGLSALFQQIEELRSEFGIEPSDNCIDVEIPCQNKYIHYTVKATIDYSRKDALSVLAGGMSEADYIMRHIASCTDDNGNILTGANGVLAKFSVTDIY